MLSFRDIASGFRQLGLNRRNPVIVHASLSAFGDVRGGAESLLGALLLSFDSLMMPSFTYQTMVIPEAGPPDNGLVYGSGRDLNRMAVPFHRDLPVDRMMGALAETLRRHPHAHRSDHPILSFSGINVQDALRTQSLRDPLAPIGVLALRGAWVLLLGVDHSVNTSIHYAEKMRERRQFVRWAIAGGSRILECPGFPGCSSGFNAIAPELEQITRRTRIGNAEIRALPLTGLLETVERILRANPRALLCGSDDCSRCQAVLRTSGEMGGEDLSCMI